MNQGSARIFAGLAALLVMVGARAESAEPAGSMQEPSFRRHVIPLLARVGCSARECHGSFAGQGGFQLSLFGYDFTADHYELTREADGGEGEVRVNRQAPERSLLVLKPTAQVKHKGKERFAPGSWEHKLLLQWIARGAKEDSVETGEFAQLEVSPREIIFRQAGDKTQLKVVARWQDGTVEDVTGFTRFRSNDDAVAAVSESGVVESRGKGDTHVVAFYDNGVTPIPVMLPVTERTGAKYPVTLTRSRLDELIVNKLRKLGLPPSDLCTDEEFLRRASLDVSGTLPTPDEVRKFLAERAPDKRPRKIEELLASPGHAAWWATRLSDFTGNSARQIFTQGVPELNGEFARQWWEWFYRRIARNEPYDQLAAGIILAVSRSKPDQSYKDYALEMVSYLRREQPADFAERETMPHFWARKNVQKPEDRALAFAHAFLGVRIDCAQCHKHPFDQWTKEDYVQFQQFFEPVRYDSNIRRDDDVNFVTVTKEIRAAMGGAAATMQSQMRNAQADEARRRIDAGQIIPMHEVYIATRNPRSTTARKDAQAYSGRVLTPKLLGGDKVLLSEYADPREPLVAWLRSKENPFFARALVNRVWANYFHRGLIEPVDDINLANPPVNAEVMDYLADDFIAHGYDMRRLHRLILNSDTYQRSWRPKPGNESDDRNFSRFVLRRLPAEVLLDAVALATAGTEEQKKFPVEVAARQIGPNVAAFGLTEAFAGRNVPDYALTIFGKPPREMNCDCERASTPTLLQSLYLRNDSELLARIESQREQAPAWITELRAAHRSAPVAGENLDPLITEVFARAVSRRPTADELLRARAAVAAARDPIDGIRDLLWTMINTREFSVNH